VKNPEAIGRLEALLARVIGRKSQPRLAQQVVAAQTTTAKHKSPSIPPPTPSAVAAPELAQHFETRSAIESQHASLVGNDGAPEISMFERTMDFDISTVERASALIDEPVESVTKPVPVEPLAVELEGARRPVLRAPSRPEVRTDTHPKAKEPLPVEPVREPAPVVVPRQEVPVVAERGTAPVVFTPGVMQTPADAVRVVALAPKVPASFAVLLKRSLSLKVRAG
jgi:hypothetical protein